MKKNLLFVLGTRPEAIKMSPLINEFKTLKDFRVIVCNTGQHKDMVKQILKFFNIKEDFDFNLMKPKQSIIDIKKEIFNNMSLLFKNNKIDYIFVHGDTSTAFASAEISFYNNIPIVHIESGLRSNNILSPFPEEMNRVFISKIASWHFCPTLLNKKNLFKENIKKNVFVVGNTVIDALNFVNKKLKNNSVYFHPNVVEIINNKKFILVTIHRRENLGLNMENIFKAILHISNKLNVNIIFPVHPNPKIKNIANKIFKNKKKIILLDPLDYFQFVFLMKKCFMIFTDSGGIQEEAISFGKPIFVFRNETERIEAKLNGNIILVGTDYNKIIKSILLIAKNDKKINQFKILKNPYGTGNSAKKIANIFLAKIK